MTDRRAFIRSFVKQIRVTGNEVCLEYQIPLPPDDASREAAEVLGIVHHGGR